MPNTRDAFVESIQEDIANSKYGKDVEEGILQLINDISSKKLRLEHTIQKSFILNFIFSPNFNEHNPNGLVIMGSSNLTAQGLGLEAVNIIMK